MEKKKQVNNDCENIDKYFATEVIEQSKRNAKKWFLAWMITFIALIGTNVYWIYEMNSYEYIYQDGNGQNNYNNEVNGDINNGTTN